ncbi:MAG TPA: hypothetical protein DCX06_02185 [Opitutae bacterium]|nr:hypothetical protein [Opitutae bacterium]
MEHTPESFIESGARGLRLMSPVLRGALLAGVIVHLAGFLIFRVTSNPLPTRDASESFVRYISAGSMAGDRALEEQAQLFDSAPLFVPTKWNAAQNVSLMPRDRISERFPEFEPEINVAEALHSTSLPMVDDGLVTTPVDLLKLRFWSLFETFGQVRQEIEVYPTIGHFGEVFIVGDEGSSISMECELVFTDTAAVPNPVTLFLRINGAAQALGDPIVSESSGNPVFDQSAQDWLRKPETQGKLPFGYLRIQVYP